MNGLVRSYDARLRGMLASLFVAARAMGAQWRVDGGLWRDSGEVESGLTPGVHSISYREVAGFATLPDESVTATASSATVVSTTYGAAVLLLSKLGNAILAVLLIAFGVQRRRAFM